jgi:hypothetical protein
MPYHLVLAPSLVASSLQYAASTIAAFLSNSHHSSNEATQCETIHAIRYIKTGEEMTIAHGDQARASAFAERGYKMRVICEGEDSPETRKLKDLRGIRLVTETLGLRRDGGRLR